jgi:hypothetical protein
MYTGIQRFMIFFGYTLMSCSNHDTGQHSQQKDFFERVKDGERRFESDLKAIHLEQERRREAEHEKMRQRKEAWHKKQAEEKQQLLEQEAKEKEEQLYKEKCRLRGEAWLREAAERGRASRTRNGI